MLGIRIAELRMQHDWSQSQLAHKLHVSIKTIKNWESDISDPSAEHIVLLSHIFQVSSDYLLGISSNAGIFSGFESLTPVNQFHLRKIVMHFMAAAEQK